MDHRWMDGWMDGWMANTYTQWIIDGWMDGWTDGGMKACALFQQKIPQASAVGQLCQIGGPFPAFTHGSHP